MPHATEGDLHAWIDGALTAIDPEGARRLSAHLDRCADCAARLEEERAIRGRANELLGAALPAEPPLPFAEITGGAPSGPRRRGPERFAWAASIVLALGAGWMGHALLRGTGDPLETARSAGADASVAEAGAPVTEAGAPADEAGESEPGAAASLDAASSGLEDRVDELRQENEAATPPAGRRRSEQQAVGAARAGAEADADRSPADVAGGDEAAALQELRAVAVQPSASESFADEAADLPEAAWRSTDLEEATAWAGRGPIIVPGLQVVDVAVADPVGDRLVRVRQSLEDGVVIELIERVGASPGDLRYAAGEPAAEGESVRDAQPAPTAPAPAARIREDVAKAADAPAVLHRVIDGVSVTASARLAPDSLAALLSRARSPEP